jgi:HSP20 family protein
VPAVNVTANGEAVTVTVEVPGIDPDDVEVSVDGDTLTIKGEKKDETKEEGEGYYRSERTFGSFVRRVPLPSEVDPEKADASIDAGVLTLRLPRATRERSRSIPIGGNGK